MDNLDCFSCSKNTTSIKYSVEHTVSVFKIQLESVQQYWSSVLRGILLFLSSFIFKIRFGILCSKQNFLNLQLFLLSFEAFQKTPCPLDENHLSLTCCNSYTLSEEYKHSLKKVKNNKWTKNLLLKTSTIVSAITMIHIH